MHILSSGSFINFENKEKLEQLVFTAKEIANSAAGTEGFLNQDESNKCLALEIWQGAEYMCREHEEAQIKNIFINNFLERLREICGAPKILTAPTHDSRQIPDTPPLNTAVVPKDEFIGVVSTENTPEQGSNPTEIKSCDPGNNLHISDHFSPGEVSDSAIKNENPDAVANELRTNQLEDNATPITATEIQNVPLEQANETPSDPVQEFIAANGAENKINAQTAVSSITLPEREAYQFDQCTVTATIQMLPSENGIRKTIVSVRTHDFAPQFSSFEITGEATSTNLLPPLEKAFEKYRNDLPVKVIDKLKKEKAVGKKPPPNNQNSPNPVARTEATEAGNPAAHKQETELQGSLFG